MIYPLNMVIFHSYVNVYQRRLWVPFTPGWVWSLLTSIVSQYLAAPGGLERGPPVRVAGEMVMQQQTWRKTLKNWDQLGIYGWFMVDLWLIYGWFIYICLCSYGNLCWIYNLSFSITGRSPFCGCELSIEKHDIKAQRAQHQTVSLGTIRP